MARLVRDARMETREVRKKLAASKEPHWRVITKGTHLGYYKGAKGTSWCVRVRKDGKYVYETLGLPDDHLDANNDTILSYAQAQERAAIFADKILGNVELAEKQSYTFNQATEEYIADFKANGKKSLYATMAQVNAHILPAFGEKLVSSITYNQLNAWKNKLATTPKRARTSKFIHSEQQYIDNKEDDPEYSRRRRSTANRIITILKAILNHAYHNNRVHSDDAWKRLKPFKNVAEAKIRFLTEAEATRLLNACDHNFKQLVRAALLTGARYSELTRLKIGDFHQKNSTIFIAESKNGKSRNIPLNEEGKLFFAQLTIGRTHNEIIFLRGDGTQWKRSYQTRPLEAACNVAKITPTISFHILRHSYASSLAARGVPLQVIAAVLGHSDTRVTHKHYAHLMPSYIADVINQNLPNFGKTFETNIKSLEQMAAKKLSGETV